MSSPLTSGMRAELRAVGRLLNAAPETTEARAVQSVARAMAVLGPRRWRANLGVSAADVETFNRLLERAAGATLFYCESSLTGVFYDENPPADVASAAAVLLRDMLRGASRFQVSLCANPRCRRGPAGERALVIVETGRKGSCSAACKRR